MVLCEVLAGDSLNFYARSVLDLRARFDAPNSCSGGKLVTVLCEVFAEHSLNFCAHALLALGACFDAPNSNSGGNLAWSAPHKEPLPESLRGQHLTKNHCRKAYEVSTSQRTTTEKTRI